MKIEFDSPWKEAIHLYFERFLEFFFPAIWADIDWRLGYTMLDKELNKLSARGALGSRTVDALVRVTRLAGEEEWVLIHLEVQSQVDPHFEARMAQYHCRIRDYYNRDVCTLAILGDEVPGWRPRFFRRDLWGCRLTLRFPVRKLLNFPKFARKHDNPFSWLVASHRQAQMTRDDPQSRRTVKLRLVRGLYLAGLGRERIVEFFRFIDWLLKLPSEIEYSFQEDLASLEEEQQMVYITSVERILIERETEKARTLGLAEGKAEGKAEALRQAILICVEEKWGTADSAVVERLSSITSSEELHEVLRLAMRAETESEFRELWR